MPYLNEDEIKSMTQRALLVLLTTVATSLHLHVGGADVASVATDMADLIVALWGTYDHWNMKKVPEQPASGV